MVVVLILVLIGAGCGRAATHPTPNALTPASSSANPTGSIPRSLKGSAFCEALLPLQEASRVVKEAMSTVKPLNPETDIEGGACYYFREEAAEIPDDISRVRVLPVLILLVDSEGADETYEQSYTREKTGALEGGYTKGAWPEVYFTEVSGLGDRAFYVSRPVPAVHWLQKKIYFDLHFGTTNLTQLTGDSVLQAAVIELANIVHTRIR